jgi:hypothetical protein
MNYLLIHLVTGIIGYLLIIKAFDELNMEDGINHYIRQLPSIILGPIGIVCGLLLLWDVYTDPPDRKK